jgi:hypothetical protein
MVKGPDFFPFSRRVIDWLFGSELRNKPQGYRSISLALTWFTVFWMGEHRERSPNLIVNSGKY